LKRTYDTAVMSVWPPGVIASAGTRFIQAGAGVLKSVKAVGRRISVTIQDGDLTGTASIEWDAPPSVAAVEKVLRAHIGDRINEIRRP
jgi:hypothetical protein